jgi:hypothetical protein
MLVGEARRRLAACLNVRKSEKTKQSNKAKVKIWFDGPSPRSCSSWSSALAPATGSAISDLTGAAAPRESPTDVPCGSTSSGGTSGRASSRAFLWAFLNGFAARDAPSGSTPVATNAAHSWQSLVAGVTVTTGGGALNRSAPEREAGWLTMGSRERSACSIVAPACLLQTGEWAKHGIVIETSKNNEGFSALLCAPRESGQAPLSI